MTIHSIRRARGELYVVAQCVYQFQVRLFGDPGPVPIPYKGLSLSVIEGRKGWTLRLDMSIRCSRSSLCRSSGSISFFGPSSPLALISLFSRIETRILEIERKQSVNGLL